MKNSLLKSGYLLVVTLIISLFFISSVTGQTTFYTRLSGSWSTNTTWSLSSGGTAVNAGIFPVAGDIVNIEGGYNVNIPAGTGMACAVLNITSVNAGNGTLTFNSGSSLSVSGNITVGTAGTTKAAVINMTAGGTVTCNGNLTIGSNTACSITQGVASTVTVNGNVTILQPTVNNITNAWNVNAGIATVNGIFILDGINTTNSRRTNLVITTGTMNANGGIQVNGTTAATKTINMTGASSVLNIGGSGISGALAATFTRGSGTSVVNYNGTGNQVHVGNYSYFNLTTSGSGTKTLLGSCTVNGTLKVTAGTTLSLSGFNVTPGSVVLECGAVSGSSITGTGTILLGGNITVNDAPGAGSSAANISASVLLGGNRTITIADDGTPATDLLITGIIGGNNSITKQGVGTLEFAAANTYTGTTNIRAGILKYAVNNAIAGGAITINGGTLDIKSYSDVVGKVTLTNGTIAGTSGILSGTSYAVANGTIDAILGGTGDLTKTTSSTVIINGLNSYAGATTIRAGTLSINSIANSGFPCSIGTGATSSTISIAATGILLYTGTGHTSNRIINITARGATIDASGTGTLTLTGGITGNRRNFTLTGTGIAKENGVIATSSGTFTKNGSGTWELGRANTFTGLTSINAGILRYAINNALATGAVTVNGGTLDISTFSDAVGILTLIDGNIYGSTGILTGNSYIVSKGNISAILAGSGYLTKTTTGTVTLSGMNTYTGVTNINAGILSVSTIGNGNAAGNLGAASNASSNLVLGGGTLQYTGVTASTNRNYTLTAGTTSVIEIAANELTISGASTNTTGALTKSGAGILILSGNNLHRGTTTINTGTIRISGSERISDLSDMVINGVFDMGGYNETVASLSGPGTVNSSSAGNLVFTVGNTNNTTFSGLLQNGNATSVALVKKGTGELTLSGNNNYTGKTTINAGSIVLGTSEVLPNKSVVLSGGNINTGTSTGYSETIGDLTVNANSSINLGTGIHTLTIANSSANTWSATTLLILGWTGSGGIINSGIQGKIMVGTGGLSAAQLAKITFSGFNPGAAITATGELVPLENAYYSTGSGAPNLLSSWNLARDGSGSNPGNFTSGSLFIVQNSHTMTTTANWSVSGLGSKVWIEDGGTLVANNSITLSAATTFQADNGATYIHNNTGTASATVFAGIEVFAPNSNVIITNWSNTNTPLITGVKLPFGNLDINWNAGGNWPQSITGAINFTAGDFIINSLGNISNEFRLTPASNGAALIFEVGGNLDINNGTLVFAGGGGNGAKVSTVNIAGDVSIYGSLDMNSVNSTNGAIALNIGGNLNITGIGLLKSSLSNGSRTVNFMKASGIQTFNSTTTGINSSNIIFNVGTSASTNTLQLLSHFIMANAASLNILNNATLDCGTYIVQATTANTQGNFTLNSGANILIGSPQGISATGATGNIQTAASRSFHSAANYTYNGTVPQVCGTGLTAAKNLVINNSAGVSLSANVSVNDTLFLTTGNVDCGVYTLSVNNADVNAISYTAGYIMGFLERNIATGTNVYEYPVGTLTGYTPVSLDFVAVTSGGKIKLKTTDGIGGNYPASLSAIKKLNRDWNITNNGVGGFTVNANFTFLPGDLAGGATTDGLRAYRADPGPAYSFTSSDNYEISGTNFMYNNLTSFSNNSGFTEFGAGECKDGFAPSFTKTMASSCGGGADGTITVSTNGGTAPYTYNWTGPDGYTASTASITGLASGDYTLLVTEVTGCTATLPDITIWQAQAPTVSNNGGISGSCNNSGYIILYGSYGVPPFTYSIDGTNYQASNTFTNLTAGMYNGYVKDSAGCVGVKSNINIAAALPLVLTSYVRPASSCANNGSIELYLTGGIAPYTYSLNDITYQASNTFTSLAGGTYTGWVKDSKGCKASLTGITVTKATAITVTATKLNSSACSNTGFIEIQAGGGVPGYSYSLTGAAGPWQHGNKFTGLAPGIYNAWVQDSKGCKNVQFGIVIGTDPASAIIVTSYVRNSGSCSSNGTIELYRTGGVGPYTYSLDNINFQVSNVFTGLASGTYTAWVKDSKGCKGSLAGIILNQYPQLKVTGFKTNTSKCVNDGSIRLSPVGGLAPYTYSIDNIIYQSNYLFTGLATGNYTAWVTDSKGCKASLDFTISLNPIIVTGHAASASSCGSSDGSIQLFLTGGTGPYSYSLDGSLYVTTNTFTGLNAGIYTGYVKDSKGCVENDANITVGPSCPLFANNAGKQLSQSKYNSEVSEKRSLQVNAYPNPTNEAFNVLLNNETKEKVIITVTDILGKKLFLKDVTGIKVYTFGNDLKPGIYILEVLTGSDKQRLRVIKQ